MNIRGHWIQVQIHYFEQKVQRWESDWALKCRIKSHQNNLPWLVLGSHLWRVTRCGCGKDVLSFVSAQFTSSQLPPSKSTLISPGRPVRSAQLRRHTSSCWPYCAHLSHLRPETLNRGYLLNGMVTCGVCQCCLGTSLYFKDYFLLAVESKFQLIFMTWRVCLSRVIHDFPVALRSAEFNVFYRVWFKKTVYLWQQFKWSKVILMNYHNFK